MRTKAPTLLVELRPSLYIHLHPQTSKRLHLRFYFGRTETPGAHRITRAGSPIPTHKRSEPRPTWAQSGQRGLSRPNVFTLDAAQRDRTGWTTGPPSPRASGDTVPGSSLAYTPASFILFLNPWGPRSHPTYPRTGPRIPLAPASPVSATAHRCAWSAQFLLSPFSSRCLLFCFLLMVSPCLRWTNLTGNLHNLRPSRLKASLAARSRGRWTRRYRSKS